MKTNFFAFCRNVCRIERRGLALASSVALSVAATPSVIAQAITRPADTDPIQTKVRQLGTGDFSRRQAAMWRLWRQRGESRSPVGAASDDPDLETAARAEWILNQWRNGIVAGDGDVRPRVKRRRLTDPIDHSRADGDWSHLDDLLVAGRFGAVTVAVEESAGTVDHEPVVRRVASLIRLRYASLVKRAVDEDLVNELTALVDVVADTPLMALARLDLMRLSGQPVGVDQLLPAASSQWTRDERERTRVALLFVEGRVDEALAAAAAMDDGSFLRRVLMAADRWEIAYRHSLDATRTEIGPDRTEAWNDVLCVADLAAITVPESVRRRAIADLGGGPDRPRAAPGETTPDETTPDDAAAGRPTRADDAVWRAVQVLLVNGELEAAIRACQRIDPIRAAEIAHAVGDFNGAANLLGYPIGNWDRSIEDWIDQGLTEQAEFAADSIQSDDTGRLGRSPKMQRLSMLIKVAFDAGRRDIARRIVDRLIRTNVDIDGISLRDYVLFDLGSASAWRWIIAASVPPGESEPSPIALRQLADRLNRGDAKIVDATFHAVGQMRPELTPAERLGAAVELLLGRWPGGFDRMADGDRLMSLLSSSSVNRRRRSRSSIGTVSFEFADVFLSLGRSDLAERIASVAAQRGKTEAQLFLAQRGSRLGSGDAARRGLDRLLDVSSRQGSVSDRITPENLAAGLLLRRKLAYRNRNDDQFERTTRQIEALLAWPSSRRRGEVANQVGGSAIDATLVRSARNLLARSLKVSWIVGAEPTSMYQAAYYHGILTAESKPDQAAKWFHLVVARSDSYRLTAYFGVRRNVLLWHIESALSARRESLLRRRVDALLSYHPLAIGFAEDQRERLRQAGFESLADEILDRILAVGADRLDHCPFDAATANNMAWLAATSGRRLELARRLSRRAVDLEPDSAIYRDTLAEVLFRLGKREEALLIEHGCLLDDAGQWHLHEQIERFHDPHKS